MRERRWRWADLIGRGGVRERRIPPPSPSALLTTGTSRDSLGFAVGETARRCGRVDADVQLPLENSSFGSEQVSDISGSGELEETNATVARVDVCTSGDDEASVAEAFKQLVVGYRRIDPFDSDKFGSGGSAAVSVTAPLGSGSLRQHTVGAHRLGRTAATFTATGTLTAVSRRAGKTTTLPLLWTARAAVGPGGGRSGIYSCGALQETTGSSGRAASRWAVGRSSWSSGRRRAGCAGSRWGSGSYRCTGSDGGGRSWSGRRKCLRVGGRVEPLPVGETGPRARRGTAEVLARASGRRAKLGVNEDCRPEGIEGSVNVDRENTGRGRAARGAAAASGSGPVVQVTAVLELGTGERGP